MIYKREEREVKIKLSVFRNVASADAIIMAFLNCRHALYKEEKYVTKLIWNYLRPQWSFLL